MYGIFDRFLSRDIVGKMCLSEMDRCFGTELVMNVRRIEEKTK